MPTFHLTCGLISHSSESGTRTSAPSPLRPSFSPRQSPGLQRMAGKLHAVCVREVSTRGRGSAGLSSPCKHLAGERDRATHGALGRGALLGHLPLQGHSQDSMEQQQRWQQQEGCAGPGERHGGVTCAGGEWRMSAQASSFPGPRSQAPSTARSSPFQELRIKASRFPGPNIPSLRPFLP